MRYFSLIFLIVVFVFEEVCAQDSIAESNFVQSLDLLYGQKFFHNNVLDASVSNIGGDLRFGKPVSYIGIQFTGTLNVSGSIFRGERSYPCSMNFYHIIPQRIDIGDSIYGRISGFNFSFPLEGVDLFSKNRHVDLVLGGGYNMGRVRLYGDSRLEQVNAYFAPFLSLAPRFTIGKFSFQFRAEYELDITRKRWRKVWFSSSPKADLGPMKSTGLSTSASIGWIF